MLGFVSLIKFIRLRLSSPHLPKAVYLLLSIVLQSKTPHGSYLELTLWLRLQLPLMHVCHTVGKDLATLPGVKDVGSTISYQIKASERYTSTQALKLLISSGKC